MSDEIDLAKELKDRIRSAVMLLWLALAAVAAYAVFFLFREGM